MAGDKVKQVFRLSHSEARRRALEAVKTAPDGQIVTVADPTRSLDQNAAQWPILTAFARQLQWPVNGVLEYLSPEEWKTILTSAFRQEQPRVAQGYGGGMVMLGHRTREFTKQEFSDWLDFLNAVAIELQVDIRESA